MGRCDSGANDTTMASVDEQNETIDLDSAAITSIGAWTSPVEMWRLCGVYVRLANGQQTTAFGEGPDRDW